MSNALDMSLDDLIKSKKKRSREGGGSSNDRRPSKRAANSRSAPFSANKSVPRSSEPRHERDRNEAASGTVSSAIETGTKLYISNLDYGVTNDDIKELFSEVGDLKRYTIHYDKSARSKGTAEVVFARKEDALAAIKRYNNVQLDGKPIKIEYIGANLSVPAVNTQSTNGMPENTNKSSGRYLRMFAEEYHRSLQKLFDVEYHFVEVCGDRRIFTFAEACGALDYYFFVEVCG